MNNSDDSKDEYNSIVTVVFIFFLIATRICINSNQKQNMIIACINFFSMFYVLWRIYYRINSYLKNRRNKSSIFKDQHDKFKKFFCVITLVLITLIVSYILCLYFIEPFYPLGSCINDIISLLDLLFSIEDEKIVKTIIEYYRLK